MSKARLTGFDADLRNAIATDPEFAAAYFEELQREPLAVQLCLLRNHLGWTQAKLAKSMGLKQTHVSRLENRESDHLMSLYQKAAEKLGARLAIVPNGMTLVPKASRRRRTRARAQEIVVAHADRVRRFIPSGKRYEPRYKVI
jgi:transcriptional regulator with XRE-family HTH domain